MDKNYDLFEMTHVGERSKLGSVNSSEFKKEAAEIKKHLSEKFPMCKFSVTSNLYGILAEIKSSPFAIDSDEMDAIKNYAKYYLDRYNDHAFCYARSKVYYDYKQTEATPEINAISEKFQTSKSAFEKAEREKFAEEARIRGEEFRKRQEEHKKWEAEHEKVVKKIEDNVIVKDADFFAMHFMTTAINKLSSVTEYAEEYENEVLSKYFKNSETYLKGLHIRYADCHISREIYMSKEIYDLFKNELLTDFSFLSNMGGSCTLDPRVKTDFDYSNMSPEERDTVKWFNVNCVAIYCEDELKLVIDPQGHNYARYTFFPCLEKECKTHIVELYDIHPAENGGYEGIVAIDGEERPFNYVGNEDDIENDGAGYPSVCKLAIECAIDEIENGQGIEHDAPEQDDIDFDDEER